MDCNVSISCDVLNKIRYYIEESKDTMTFLPSNNIDYLYLGKKIATLLSPKEQIENTEYFISYLTFLNKFMVCIKFKLDDNYNQNEADTDTEFLFKNLTDFIEYKNEENKEEFLSRFQTFIDLSTEIFVKYQTCNQDIYNTENTSGVFARIKLGILGAVRIFKGYLPGQYVSMMEFLKWAGDTVCSCSEILRLEKIHIWLKTVLEIGTGYDTALRVMAEYVHSYCRYFNKHGIALGAAKFIIDRKVYSEQNMNTINGMIDNLEKKTKIYLKILLLRETGNSK